MSILRQHILAFKVYYSYYFTTAHTHRHRGYSPLNAAVMFLNTVNPTSRLLARSFPSGSATMLGSSRMMAFRGAATTARPDNVSMTPEQSLKVLNEQRSVRPISPHMTIYQPQLTWIGSIANRVTGTGLSVALYAYAIAFLGARYTGHAEVLSSPYLTQLVASAPFWLKLSLKAPIAAAFNYHNFNGIRHLAWDWGYCLSIKGCYQSGYAVIGATALATVGMCML
ncbi:unnamed protein product [Jaminaea pallidilutea]